MPNRSTHKALGGFAGLLHQAYRARDLEGGPLVAQLVGGTLGGVTGGALPDDFEPATSPCHRAFCHSGVAAVGVAALLSQANQWEGWCRARANELQAERLGGEHHWLMRALLWLAEMGLHAGGAFLTGVCTGYLTHLAADGTTPASIPLIC